MEVDSIFYTSTNQQSDISCEPLTFDKLVKICDELNGYKEELKPNPIELRCSCGYMVHNPTSSYFGVIKANDGFPIYKRLSRKRKKSLRKRIDALLG